MRSLAITRTNLSIYNWIMNEAENLNNPLNRQIAYEPMLGIE